MSKLRILYETQKDPTISRLANEAAKANSVQLVEHVAGAFAPDNVALPISQCFDVNGIQTDFSCGVTGVTMHLVDLIRKAP